MSKLTPEEQYREAFYNRVQKECRKHDINCSMCYNRIHIYTKYEDFYFEPNPNEITLMHRNAQKDSDGGYTYHVQGVWESRTPESLVREVVRHTKYRYTEDGEYRAEKDIKAERDTQQGGQMKSGEKAGKKKNTKCWKTNRQAQIQEFRDELRDLCKERGWSYRDLNQLTYISNGFEEFLIEFTTTHTKIQSRRCVPLKTKETYDRIYKPDELLPIDIVEFAEYNFIIQTQDEYARAFYEFLSLRCSQSGFKCERNGNRIYIYATNSAYQLDAVCGEPIKIYQKGAQSVLVECPEDAHVIHVAHCIEEHDKAVAAKSDRNTCWFGWKIAAISGWVTAVSCSHISCIINLYKKRSKRFAPFGSFVLCYKAIIPISSSVNPIVPSNRKHRMS